MTARRDFPHGCDILTPQEVVVVFLTWTPQQMRIAVYAVAAFLSLC